MDVHTTYSKLIVLLIFIGNYQVIGIPEADVQHDDFICQKSLSCKERCQSTEQMDDGENGATHCHCDPSCHKYQDCCYDITTACPNRTLPTPSDVKFECRKINDEEPPIRMVEQCPSQFKDAQILKKCHSQEDYRSETFFDQIPVVYIMNRIIYKNKWCAFCNGVPYEHIPLLFFLKLRVKCNVSPLASFNYTQALNYIIRHCDRMQFELEQGVKRRNCFSTIDLCPANSTAEEKRACIQSPTQVVFDDSRKTNYRSIECMACHSTPDQLKQATCGPRKIPENVFKPSSFEVVMNFEMTPNKAVKIASTATRITCGKVSYHIIWCIQAWIHLFIILTNAFLSMKHRSSI